MTYDPSREDPHDESPRPDANPHAELVRLSDWGYRPLTWLWDRVIPKRKVTLLVGDQDVGKTYFAADLAARLTRGLSIPPLSRLDDGPGSVIVLEADDESDDTLYPRLEDAGADMDRVHWLTVDGLRNAGKALPQITLARDVECLIKSVRLVKDCRLIIIDPITAFIDGMSIRNDAAIRRLYSRLAVVAKISDAAVLLIHHTRKSGGDSTLHRASGAQAVTIALRFVYTIINDPNVAERKLLLPAKSNLQAREDCPGRSFFIHNHEIRWNIEPIYLRPDEVTKLTAAGLATFDRLAAIVEWLRTLLANGPVPSRDVLEQARRQNIPYVLLYKAKAKARARSVRHGVNQRWCWELIPDDQPAPPTAASSTPQPT